MALVYACLLVACSACCGLAQEPGNDSSPPEEDPLLASATANAVQPGRAFDSRTMAGQTLRQPAGRLPGSYQRLTRSPAMIADTNSGTCGTVQFLTFEAALAHPTYGCSRANIAENNSPVPQDRLIFSYQHFHNITETRLTTIPPEKGLASLDINRYVVGIEKTALEGLVSFDLRLPILNQLVSDPSLEIFGPGPLNNLPLDDTDTEIGNITLTTKAVLLERAKWTLSGGIGLNLPTAKNVSGRVLIDDDDSPIIIVPFPEPHFADVFVSSTLLIKNETVNLSPFLAALWTPNDRWYAQGFVQLDLPLNTSGIELSDWVALDNVKFSGVESGKFTQQELLRLNFGVGCWLVRRPEARFVRGFAPTVELHYTTTLEDAVLFNPLPPAFGFLPPQLNIARLYGNLANRVDILNIVGGGTFYLGESTSVAIAAIAPLRDEDDKPFDVELTAQVNYRW